MQPDATDGAIVAINGELRGSGPDGTFQIQISGGNQFDTVLHSGVHVWSNHRDGSREPGNWIADRQFPASRWGMAKRLATCKRLLTAPLTFESVPANENRNVSYENFNAVALADSNVGNNPPVNVLPTTQLATPIQTNLELYTNLINRIGVIDPDSTSITLSLSLASGTNTLFLDTFGGIFASTVTGQGTSLMTLSGSLGEITSDLFELMFVPAAGFTGVDTLTIISDDTIATDNDSIDIVVGDLSAPTIDLADPTNGGTIDLTALNARDYIEVTFADDIGLDFTTINGDEVRLSGPGLGTAQLTGVAQRQGVTSTYRFPFIGDFVAGQVTLDYIGGTFMDLAGTDNLDESESFTVIAGSSAPTIDSTPPATSVKAAEFYQYQVTATDDDAGDVLTYSLDTAPDGMTIHPETGMLQWTPRIAQIGDQDVAIRVTDAAGLAGTQMFTVTINDRNQPPTLTVDRFQTATVNELFIYTPMSADVDGDARTFSLVDAPAGMTINPTSGEIRWTPTAAQVGTEQAVTVKASTQSGEFASDRIHFTVSPPPGDFDNDGDRDGFDFLTWQRGFGTIYDANDLATWQANYGQSAPLLASSAPLSASSAPLPAISDSVSETILAATATQHATAEVAHPTDPVEPESTVNRGQLIDAAIMLNLEDDTSSDAIGPALDGDWFDLYEERWNTVSDQLPTEYISEDDQTAPMSKDKVGKHHEERWLTDELLESVFE